jgi:hypothetical protein
MVFATFMDNDHILGGGDSMTYEVDVECAVCGKVMGKLKVTYDPKGAHSTGMCPKCAPEWHAQQLADVFDHHKCFVCNKDTCDGCPISEMDRPVLAYEQQEGGGDE